MTVGPDLLRATAFATIGLAVILGVTTRVVALKPFGPAAEASAAPIAALRVGQSLGDAAIEGVPDDDQPGIRIRAAHCAEPIFAAPLLLTAVAIPRLVDNAYGTRSGYQKLDVYRGEIRNEFSRLSRLLARSLAGSYNSPDGFYVRFYTPKSCSISDRDFADWAGRIVSAASAGERGED
ncbi:hypothetical protein DFR50_1113 [Roseiarcus fermentans]|uniref:Uncharacterized protein n=1 Tax=Roseiarcus fermentans TaxID=1473586 RepID=A0A366FGK9_9HYPH|nr:hypothetical protein [Roseiarcus fermentans]RBP13741.1 hypothetical protein DFR50_1113 [Roseiarcus fermentans]